MPPSVMPWADEVERRFLAGDFDAVADQLRHPRPAPGSPAPGPATVLRLRARFARHCLQPRRAVRYLQAASAAARRSGDRAEEVRCLGELAEAASLFAHHEVSRQALLRLESLIPRSVDQTSGAWLSLSRGAFHLARREVPLARECFEEAVSRATAAGDREVAAESLFRLASAHAREDDFEPAQAAAEGAADLGLAEPVLAKAPLYVFTRFNLAPWSRQDENPWRFLDSRCEVARQRLAGPELGFFCGVLGSRLVEQRWLCSGVALLREALDNPGSERDELLWLTWTGAGRQGLGDIEWLSPLIRVLGWVDPGMPRLHARVHQIVAEHHRRNGTFDDGRRSLAKAQSLAIQCGDDDLRMGFLHRWTELELTAGAFAPALEHAEEALRRARSAASEELWLHSTILVGEAQIGCGKVAEAMASFADAVTLGRRCQRFYDTLVAMRSLARVGCLTGDLEFAHALHRELRPLIELQQRDRDRADYLLEVEALSRSLLEEDLATCLHLAREHGEPELFAEAFDVAQRFHNRILADVAAQVSSGLPVEDFVEERASALHESRWRGTLYTEVSTRERNLEPHPVESSPAPTLAEVQAHLEEGDLLLECIAVDSFFALFPVTRETLRPPLFVERVEVDAALADLYAGSRRCEEEYLLGHDELGPAMDHPLSRLGELLSLAEVIGDRPPKRLLVAPDGALTSLPFHALRVPASDCFLIDLVAGGIELWPTAAHLLRAPRRGAIRKALVVAQEDSDLASSKLERERLAGLVEDLEAVSSGKQALEILKTRGAEIDLLYFIGHGGQKVQGDTLSTVLSLEDRPLGAADFFRRDFRLRPGAVGLFSCCLVGRTESGLGKELTGFLRGLFYSGLSTVVAPLWSVEDETAAALMPAVCASLASGSALGVALREAVQWIRHDFSHSEIGRGVAHPYFWASYQPWGR